MTIFIPVGRMVWSGCCTKDFLRVAKKFQSPNLRKTRFWEKNEIFFFWKTSTVSSFRKVHAKFYRCRLNSLAWVLYQSLAPGSRISKIFEKVSIGITFREVHAHFYRCRPNGLAWVSYPILFAAFKKISESQFVKNANFGRKKFEFYKFSKKRP